MAKNTAHRRVGDYDKTFGKSLDEIEGKDVFIHAYSISSRPLFRDGVSVDRPFTTVEVSETEDGPVQTYHTWSESVADKMGSIPVSDLPLLAAFKSVTTGSGRTVWDVA